MRRPQAPTTPHETTRGRQPTGHNRGQLVAATLFMVLASLMGAANLPLVSCLRYDVFSVIDSISRVQNIKFAECEAAMTLPEPERRLQLTFCGEAFHDGAVPVTLLAEKLRALQAVLFHAAATVERDTTSRRGLWFNRYRPAVELTFAAAHHSDLAVEVELPASEPLLGPQFELGGAALELAFAVGDSLQRNFEGIDNLNLRHDDRAWLIRAFDALMPNPLEEYQIELENGAAGHRRLVFTGATKQSLRRFLLHESVPRSSERTSLVGELVKIHVDVAPEKVTIRLQGREIDCHYPESLRDQIANLLAGSLVEVTGEATFDVQGNVLRLDRVHDVLTVSLDPLRIARFEHEGDVYRLRKPLVVEVEYEDGLWVYFSPTINLWGSGERREEALRDLHENFAYLWREFAEESDDVLDANARQVKQTLLDITDKQPAGV